jgi:hypothetical protein
MPSLIVIKGKVGDKEREFKFRAMTLAESGQLGTKIQHRSIFFESLTKKADQLLGFPLNDLEKRKDDIKPELVGEVLKISDQIADLQSQLLEVQSEAIKYVMSPSQKEAAELLQEYPLDMSLVLKDFIEKCFVTEADRKKS